MERDIEPADLALAAPALRELLAEALRHVTMDGACLRTYSDGSPCNWVVSARALLERLDAA